MPVVPAPSFLGLLGTRSSSCLVTSTDCSVATHTHGAPQRDFALAGATRTCVSKTHMLQRFAYVRVRVRQVYLRTLRHMNLTRRDLEVQTLRCDRRSPARQVCSEIAPPFGVPRPVDNSLGSVSSSRCIRTLRRYVLRHALLNLLFDSLPRSSVGTTEPSGRHRAHRMRSMWCLTSAERSY